MQVYVKKIVFLVVIPQEVHACQPSPCGPNAQCREQQSQAICSCLPNYIGTPPACRPECTSSHECPLDKMCINHKCQDPCPGACGTNAQCRVQNHNMLCSCLEGYTGNPYSICQIIPSPPPQPPQPLPPIPPVIKITPQQEVYHDPCVPSPCGANAECSNRNGAAICQCFKSFVGVPPNCHPECIINAECPSHLACINQKCGDPCPGSCGISALCKVLDHNPICSCPSSMTGNPFTRCYPTPPSVVESRFFSQLLQFLFKFKL